MCGSTTVTYVCVCVCLLMYTYRVWLEDMWASVCHMGLQLNSSLISLGSRHICPGAILSTRFFISPKLKHVLLATLLASKPLGSVCLCSPAGLKVHTIMSGFYTFWGYKVYTLPTTPSPQPCWNRTSWDSDLHVSFTIFSLQRNNEIQKKAGSSPSSASAAMGTKIDTIHFFLKSCFETVSYSAGWTQTHHTAKSNLELWSSSSPVEYKRGPSCLLLRALWFPIKFYSRPNANN